MLFRYDIIPVHRVGQALFWSHPDAVMIVMCRPGVPKDLASIIWSLGLV